MARNQVTVGVEITPEEIRAVALRRDNGAAEVLDVACFPAEGPEPERTVRALRGFLKQAASRTGLAAGKLKVNFCLSFPSTATRIVKLPHAEPETLRQMLQYELQRHVPFPTHDLQTDFCQLTEQKSAVGETGEEKMAPVLVAMVRKEDFEAARPYIESVDGGRASCTVGSLAAADLASRWWPQKSGNGGSDDGSPVSILNADTNQATLTVYDGGGTFLTRTVEPTSPKQLVAEARRTLMGYRSSTKDRSLQGCVVIGRKAQEVLKEMNGGLLGPEGTVLPTVLADPWRDMPVSLGHRATSTVRSGSSRVSIDDPERYFVATAAALQTEGVGLSVNLLRSQQTSRRLRQGRRSWVFLGILLLGSLAWAGWRTYDRHLGLNRDRLHGLEAQVDRLRQTLPDKKGSQPLLNDTRQIEALARDARRSSYLWLETLRRLSLKLPKNVWFTEMVGETDKEVTVNGLAPASEDIAATLRTFEDLGLFSEVRLVNSRSTTAVVSAGGKSEGQQRFEFQIACTMKPLGQ
ncbi:MAG: PilN domain-containing protein [Armatimonadetes bacterium]|nr:PilN domain-containing protein [Armatimonadota bacterium]